MAASGRCLVAALILLGASLPGTGLAGTLDDFENAAGGGQGKSSTPAPRSGTARGPGDGRAPGSGLSDDLAGSLLQLVLSGVVEGSRLSLARVQGPEGSSLAGVAPRASGDADLPGFRLDLARQWVDPDVSALDARIEAGYGPFALQGRHTRFREDSPPDTLSMSYLHGVIRVAPAPILEFAIGMGAGRLSGNASRSGFSTALALTIRPGASLDIRFAPAWTSLERRTIEDYDVSIGFMPRFAGVRVGYRWLKAGTGVLRGPYVGASFYY